MPITLMKLIRLLIPLIFILFAVSCQYQVQELSVSQDKLDTVQVTALEGTILETYCAKWRTVLCIFCTIVACWGLGKISPIDVDLEIIEGHKRTISVHVGRGIAGFISGLMIWLLHLDSATVGRLILSQWIDHFLILFPLINAALWLIPVIGSITRFLEYSTSILLAIIITLTPFDGTRKEHERIRVENSNAAREQTITSVQEDGPIINIMRAKSIIEDKAEDISKDKVVSWGKDKFNAASSFIEEKSKSISQTFQEEKELSESEREISIGEKPSIFKRIWGWIKNIIPEKE